MNDFPDFEPQHLIVIGGGVAGLVAALDCARAGVRVTVVEASGRLGGAVSREVVAGIPVDTGAESYATRGGHVRRLIDELGLSDAVVKPAAAGAWVHLDDGRSEPLPRAGILGIPSVPLASDVVRVIGWRAAFRAYLDRLMPVLTIGQERNLGRLVGRRMGRAVLESLVAPVTRGVYSADPGDLDVARAAPGLNNALTTAGSLSGAVTALRSNSPAGSAGSAVEGLEGGMYRLVEALEAELRRRGARFVLGTEAVAIEHRDSGGTQDAERDHAVAASAVDGDAAGAGTPQPATDMHAAPDDELSGRWSVALADGEALEADVVLVAVPEAPALRLLAPLSGDLAEESPIDPPVVEIVTLVLDSEALDVEPRGTGVLVAGSSASGVAAKALTHSTAKWSWLAGLAASGHPHRHVVRLSYGSHGSKNPLEGLSAHQVRDRAVKDASSLLGVTLDPTTVVGLARTPWTGTLAGATIGQRERSQRIRDAVSAIDGIDVTGAWLAGTGLASVVPDAREAAGRIRHAVVEAYRAAGLDPQGLAEDAERADSETHSGPGIKPDEAGGGRSASGYPGTVDRNGTERR